ncbi:two component transcriptional regulator, LuxR family [Solimonas aquatica]|uniref:Two component transcriptional regulator, LuxR family n=1 Tax=Solimonas aquatica TaxID=489703 RepID=A0A1H9JFM9_9GAMM|nr:DNA-binding response regulator [Solimonas aquatica]SEQ85365.1 two component transcriptional regulator, LuxR family [Solimonas aquatica]
MAESERRDIVLVVDDTPDTLSFLTDTLDAAGVTVLVAVDGESALSLVEQVTPDLVLMDGVMPGLDGFETCRRMKRLPQVSQVPVIFMTGLSDTEHVLRGLSAGGVDYVTKPIVVDELLARIRVHLANARAAQASRLALDATGRFLLSTDAQGQLRWCTPRAEQLLSAVLAPDAQQGRLRFPAALAEQLLRLRRDASVPVVLELPGQRLEFSFVSSTGADEYLYRITETVADREQALAQQTQILQQQFSLTAREAEVLLWISRGKSNRDMSEILGISPRTVNKHLEQIFLKLGVANRASAAAKAVRVLS